MEKIKKILNHSYLSVRYTWLGKLYLALFLAAISGTILGNLSIYELNEWYAQILYWVFGLSMGFIGIFAIILVIRGLWNLGKDIWGHMF